MTERESKKKRHTKRGVGVGGQLWEKKDKLYKKARQKE